MNILKAIIVCSVLLLAACGGDDNANSNNGGDVTPPEIEIENENVTVMVMDFRTIVPVNSRVKRINLNLSTYVLSTKKAPLTLESISSLSNDARCEILDFDPDIFQITVSPKAAGVCYYHYAVTDGTELTSGTGSIIVTAKAPEEVTSRFSLLPNIENSLPQIQREMKEGETLSLDLGVELAAELGGMSNPQFLEATVTNGNGTPKLTTEGILTYEAISIGATFINYYVLDNNDPDDPNDDVVYTGRIIIDVSGGDLPVIDILNPAADWRYPLNELITIDVRKFEIQAGLFIDLLQGSDDDDNLQLIDVSVEGTSIFVGLPQYKEGTDLCPSPQTAVTCLIQNTAFQFVGTKIGPHDITYTIYNHSRKEVKTGIITVTSGVSLSGSVSYSLAGYLKLFKDGTVGGSALKNGDMDITESLRELSKEIDATEGLKALSIKNVSMYSFAILLSDGRYAFIGYNGSSSGGSPPLFYLDDVKNIYSKGYMLDRYLGTDVFFVVDNDKKLKAYSQLGYRNFSKVVAMVKKVNGLNLQNVKDLIMVDFGKFFISFTNGDESKVYSLDYQSDDKIDVYSKKLSEIDCLPSDMSKIKTFYTHDSQDDFGVIFKDDVCIIDLGVKHNNKLALDSLKTLAKNEGILFYEQAERISGVITNNYSLWVNHSKYNSDNLPLPIDSEFEKIESTPTMQFSLGATFIFYRKADGTVNGKSFAHMVNGGDSGRRNIAPVFDEIPSNVKFYVVGSDSVAYIKWDGSLGFISNRTAADPIKGDWVWLKGDRNVAWGDNFSGSSAYQGSNAFVAFDRDSNKYRYFSPMGDWEGAFTCKFNFDSVDVDNLLDPEIMTGYQVKGVDDCSVLLFNQDGTQGNLELKSYPSDKFTPIKNTYYPLTDLDNDGFSNVLETDLCKKSDVNVLAQKYWCGFPSQNDSDWDQVDDDFEVKYGNSEKTKNSNIKNSFPDSYFDVVDTFKDINLDGIPDWKNTNKTE